MNEGPPAAPDRPLRKPRLSRRGKVGLGLFLTLVGLFVLGGALPTSASTLERTVALAAVGVVAIWSGGLLLGSGGRR